MDWMPVVPVLIIGAFLMITWKAMSPVRFFQQIKTERKRRREEWDRILASEAEEESRLLEEIEK
ncbi:MAG: hypothetical protein HWE30_03445 [Methylocystaceae bacterium]|nr:hypothetical protein [Methylocystaceae bacterium]